MRRAAWLVALICAAIGIAGFVSPDSLMAARRAYLATATGMHAAGAIRIAMGVVIVVFAPASRWPTILRVIGAIMCVQGLLPMFYSVDRALAVVDWEAALGPMALRAGAAVALGTGALIAVAATPPRPRTDRR